MSSCNSCKEKIPQGKGILRTSYGIGRLECIKCVLKEEFFGLIIIMSVLSYCLMMYFGG